MKKPFLLFVCLALFVCALKGQQTTQGSSLNKATTISIFQAFDNGDTDALDNLIAKDAITHSEMPPGMTSTGLEAVKEICKMQKKAFPDIKTIIHTIAVAGDTVMAYYTSTGTNTGSFFGMPATNKRINVEGVDIMRFQNGKAVEHWGVYDNLKMMQQLGIMPAPQPSPDKIKE